MRQKTGRTFYWGKVPYAGVLLFCLCLLLLLAAPSCTAKYPENPSEGLSPESPAEEETEVKEEEEEEVIENQPAEQKEAAAINEELPKPNELGEIMILMYHEIGSPEDEWRRTPDNFRKDLQTLYDLGYRAVSLQDMVRGRIEIPAGTSPVVLTFDDGNKGNFNYLETEGEPELDPDCAVAIMEDFYRENPDFGLAATFFIYWPNPFRQLGYLETKLQHLVKQGFEIGNHTNSHANLSRLNPDEIRRELALHISETQKIVPGYRVTSLSLPYGAYSQDPLIVREGSYEGIYYQHEAVLLVGANPAPSPYHEKFDPFRLPRIRASEIKTDGVGMYEWLEYFRTNPSRRFISDGDANCITIPLSAEQNLNREITGEKDVRLYE